MDPLSDLLSLLRPTATVSSGFQAGGDWSIRFADPNSRIKCYAILSGECWMAVDGVAEPLRLVQGEAFVLPHGRPFRLASELALDPIESSTLFPPERPGGTVVLGNEQATFSLAGARFGVDGRQAGPLLGLLPPVVHLDGRAEQAALRWSVERMRQEMRDEQPGGDLLKQDLARMMLIQALRAYVSGPDAPQTGWLAALSEPRLRRALEAMHAEPGRRWSLQELGGEAAMSRTVFATRFRGVVGETPMQYLARWRMLLACDHLERSAEPVALVASQSGYESIAAFSTAFKRVVGCSPQQYRRGGRPASP